MPTATQNSQIANNAPDNTISEYLQKTLVKYYEGLLSINEKIHSHKASKNYTINVDWLQFICKCPALFSTYFENKEGEFEPYEIKKGGNIIRMEITGKKTSLYEHHCLIHIKPKGSRKFMNFGVALFEPHKGLNNLKDWYFQIQINNSLLYSDWLSMCKLFLALTGFQFDHFVRVDVALDSPDRMLLDAVGMVKNSQLTQHSSTPTPSLLHHAGKSKISYSDIGKGTKYQIGAGSSDKKLKIYNKTAEIKQSSQKAYISQYHKDNLDIDNEDVLRYELQMNAKFIESLPQLTMLTSSGEVKKICDKPIGLDELADSDFLAKLWNFGTNSLIDFRYQPKGSEIKNVAYWEKIQFFDLSESERARVLNTEEPNTASLYGVKIVVKNLICQLYTKRIDGRKQKRYLTLIKEQLERFALQDWFEFRLQRWRDEFDKELYLEQKPSCINWEKIELLTERA